MEALISGIGRSGTTTIYQILGKGILSQYAKSKCFYEPYLWNIKGIEKTAIVKGQAFNVGQVGLENIRVHCETPLFLSQSEQVHDQWLDSIFRTPDTKYAMAKVIRGAGRIESALKRYPELKVVILIRNVVDTVNSGLGLFSFFGDEFHVSDKARFLEAVNVKYGESYRINDIVSEVEWSVLWWKYMTMASLEVYDKYPDRVMAIPYEMYVSNKKKYVDELFDFFGIKKEFIDNSVLTTSAGSLTSVSYLTSKQINALRPNMEWYSKVLESRSLGTLPKQFINILQKRFSSRDYSESLLLSESSDKTTVQWRILLDRRQKEFKQNHQDSLSVSKAMVEFGLNFEASKSGNTSKNKTVGVLITCFNNEDTIEETIRSVLLQTRQPDLIVIADDCSTDASHKIIERMSEKSPLIRIDKRVANLGVAANRDLSIRSMDVDYISTLDGDDVFMPGKIEAELMAINGSCNRVAFSDIGLMTKKGTTVQETAGYSGMGKKFLLRNIASRRTPVPRDMLFPKKLFEEAQGFDVGMSIYEDWAFKMRLMLVTEDNGWIHSGVIGTVYDRRQPGLSAKPEIFHGYGQLMAISRNAKEFVEYPEVIDDGLKTVVNCLSGEIKERLKLFINNSSHDEKWERLNNFWSNERFNYNVKYMSDRLLEFTVLK
jgi:glycosyltransferase involved in cell wall biosynthesis